LIFDVLVLADLTSATPVSAAELERHRRKELRKVIEQREAAQNIVVYLDACNLDALVKVVRNSLEVLKKRISTNTAASSGDFCL